MRSSYKIVSSKTLISSGMAGHSFLVYQGRRFIRIVVNLQMVGFYFGEFIKTRKLHDYNKK
jgi:ribosomal protein S19